MKKALIMIDIQNDYFKGGNMECAGMEDAGNNAARLLAEFRRQQCPVFHVQHIAERAGATFFLPGTEGVDINAVVAPKSDERVIVKHLPNSFQGTSLLEELRQLEVNEMVICGAMTQMCIDATTRAAFDFGFDCIVVDDACAARSLTHNGQTVGADKVHAAFMAALSTPYANVVSTAKMLDSHA